MSETPSYTFTARTLHWITATLVLFMLPLGLVIGNNWGGPLQDWLYNLHRSIGALLIPIVWTRVIYRLGHTPPPLPDDIPPWQQFVANATHWGLYILLIVQPFVGWIGVSAYPATITVFGLFDLPSLWHEDRAFSDQVLFVHSLIGLAITLLAAAHIGAALHHHFVRRDGILARMTTG